MKRRVCLIILLLAAYFLVDKVERSLPKLSYIGFGVELSKENDEIKVHSVFANSPAERAGILSGDVITAVSPTGKKENLIPVSGLKLETVRNLLRGKKGAKVLFSISRKGQSISNEIERGEVKIESTIFRKLIKKLV